MGAIVFNLKPPFSEKFVDYIVKYSYLFEVTHRPDLDVKSHRLRVSGN